MIDRKIIICDCGSIEHQLAVYKDSDFPDGNKEVIISIHLNSYDGFLKRLWIATKYLFGYKSKYGNWDEIIITKDNYGPLKDAMEFLDK
jgi:hypothetical protein